MANESKFTEKEMIVIAGKFKQYRMDDGMSQRVLADRMGMPGKQRLVGQIENGKKIPTKSYTLAFAKAVGVEFSDVVTKSVFDKLPEDLEKVKAPVFDIEENTAPDEDLFNIVIPLPLLDMVAKNNPAGIPISFIIAAGLNHFANMSYMDGLQFVFMNAKHSGTEKKIILDILEKKQFVEGIEMFKAFLERN